MRRIILFLIVMAGIFVFAHTGLARGNGKNFIAVLDQASEVPPPSETGARGQASFRVKRGVIEHRLNVARLVNILAAHIHCAPEGEAGPVGVTLFSGGPVTLNGTLSSGPIEEPDAGNACGWQDLDDVIDALRSGDTYVNVHTLANPPGEIRGQID